MEYRDEDVISRIKRGEIDWYGVIVKKYTARIHQYVSSRLFDRAEADDIVQKTFIHFYRAIDRFDVSRQVVPYLYEIAKNELKMYYRSRKETVPLNERIAGEQADDPELEMDDLLRGVTPDQRKAIRMLYEGYTYREIAATLRRPINTIRTIIRRARLSLSVQHHS